MKITKFTIIFLQFTVLTSKLSLASLSDRCRDTISQCTKDNCSNSADTWNQCFNNCWFFDEARINGCIIGARNAGRVNPGQQYIIRYFSGVIYDDPDVDPMRCEGNYDNPRFYYKSPTDNRYHYKDRGRRNLQNDNSSNNDQINVSIDQNSGQDDTAQNNSGMSDQNQTVTNQQSHSQSTQVQSTQVQAQQNAGGQAQLQSTSGASKSSQEPKDQGASHVVTSGPENTQTPQPNNPVNASTPVPDSASPAHVQTELNTSKNMSVPHSASNSHPQDSKASPESNKANSNNVSKEAQK